VAKPPVFIGRSSSNDPAMFARETGQYLQGKAIPENALFFFIHVYFALM
jgi:hypothetical protein